MNLELTDQNQDDSSVDSGVDSSVKEQTDQDASTSPPNEQETHKPGLDEYLANGYDYEVPKRGDIREGTIIARDNGLVVDIGFKREGIVPSEDLSRLDDQVRADINVGDKVSVFVLRPANREGQPILSIHQARMYEDWIQVEKMMKEGELYEGEVTGFNRGGLIVKFGKIRGFVPASQVVGLPRRLREEQRRQRLEALIGEKIGLKIIEVDRKRRRLIFSQRRALRAWQDIQRERVMEELVEGETRHGKVTSITHFGAFVDLGGADGLIHVSEMSWCRVDDPHDVLKVGEEVDVYVLNVDKKRKRIALSLKKLLPDPWTLVDDHYHVGQLVEGEVTRVLDFGAFVKLDIDIEGLLHVSEMIGTPELKPSDIVHPGETMPVKIIRIESGRKRIALSAKQVRRDEWERWVAAQQTAEMEAAEAEAEVEEEETTEVEAAAEQPQAEAEEAKAQSQAAEPEEQPSAESPPTPTEETTEEEPTAPTTSEEEPMATEEALASPDETEETDEDADDKDADDKDANKADDEVVEEGEEEQQEATPTTADTETTTDSEDIVVAEDVDVGDEDSDAGEGEGEDETDATASEA